MTILFSFLRQKLSICFLICFVVSISVIKNISLASIVGSSSATSTLDNQCSFGFFNGEDDLIPWPLSQCPLNMYDLYGSWQVQKIATVSGTSSTLSTVSKQTEIYKIFTSALGMSIIRYKANGTKDRGFIIFNGYKNSNNHHKAFMYSSAGNIYYLSIYAYLPSPVDKKEVSCNGGGSKSIKQMIFVQHRVQSFVRCEGNVSQSWLLERQ